jgi:hypothetical protein
MVGVGVGSMIRNQTAALVVALTWATIVEGLLVSFVPEVSRCLPGVRGPRSPVSRPLRRLLPTYGAAALLFTATGWRSPGQASA